MLHWVNQFAVTPDQPGGTRHHEMGRELVRRGREVSIVASDLNLTSRSYGRRSGPRDRRHLRERVDGVEFVWLPAGSYRANDWRRALSMVAFGVHVLLHLLRAPMPAGSVVIGSSPHLLAAAAARLAAAARRRPFVLEVRDLWPESMAEVSGRTGALTRVLQAVADWLYRSSDEIVVLAAANADAIAERGAERSRIHHIPNGVDPAAFDAAAPVRPADVDPGSTVFVYAGAHGPANGLDVVLDAAAELQRRDVGDVTVLLVGDGPAKPELEQRAAALQLRNLRFHDPVPKGEMPALLKGCDVGLMVLADVPLFRRGVSPNKLFDYFCAGLPVVTNVPGLVASMVRDAEAGVEVPPGDPVALADAMATLADTPRTAGNGRAWVAEHHGRQVLAARLEGLLDRLSAGERVVNR